MTPKKRVCKQKRPGRINNAFLQRSHFRTSDLREVPHFCIFNWTGFKPYQDDDAILSSKGYSLCLIAEEQGHNANNINGKAALSKAVEGSIFKLSSFCVFQALKVEVCASHWKVRHFSRR